MKNHNPFGRPTDRLAPPSLAGLGVKEEELRGPLPCPKCAGTTFEGKTHTELYVHRLNEKAQAQKHRFVWACVGCGCIVDTLGKEVSPKPSIEG